MKREAAKDGEKRLGGTGSSLLEAPAELRVLFVRLQLEERDGRSALLATTRGGRQALQDAWKTT